MPETPIDKDGNSLACKDHVGAYSHVASPNLMVLTEAKTLKVQRRAQCHLWPRITATVPPHDRGRLLSRHRWRWDAHAWMLSVFAASLRAFDPIQIKQWRSDDKRVGMHQQPRATVTVLKGSSADGY